MSATDDLFPEIVTAHGSCAPLTEYAPAVGAVVSMKRWDATEPPRNKMGQCTVVDVERRFGCQTGIMLTLRNAVGKEVTLDSAWVAGEAQGYNK
jgi:hypothetical protein